LRIALVSSGLVPVFPIRGGAVEEYVYQLSRYLRKLGVDAVVMDANHDSDSSFTRRSMKHGSLKFQQPNRVQCCVKDARNNERA
jgi:predicted alpha/beta-fold hydrolase